MMPDFKFGITFSFFHHVQADLQSACNVYKDFQSGTSVPSSLLFCILYFFFSDYKSLYSMMRVCQNRHILFFYAKPRLSQARALLCRKVFVPLQHAK